MCEQKPNSVLTFFATYICDLDTTTPRTWSYARPDDSPIDPSFVKWEVATNGIDGQPSGKLNKRLTTRANVLKRHILPDDDFSAYTERVSNGVFRLLARNEIEKPDSVDVVALNHFVSAESTKPICTFTTVTKRLLMAEVRGLSPRQRCWFCGQFDRPAGESVIGELVLFWPDYFLEPKPNNKYAWKDKNEIERLLESYRIKRTTRIDGYQLTNNGKACLYRLKVTAELVRYHRGRLSNCIPMPGKSHDPPPGLDEPVAVCSPEIVITSPVVQKAIKDLDHVWRDRFASSVLVTGPPGCGKEDMAKSLVYGSGRPGKDIQTLSLAQGDTSEHERRLFGRRCADGGEEQGLIERAKGSALFLDEAHHPIEKEGIRASLLRDLES